MCLHRCHPQQTRANFVVQTSIARWVNINGRVFLRWRDRIAPLFLTEQVRPRRCVSVVFSDDYPLMSAQRPNVAHLDASILPRRHTPVAMNRTGTSEYVRSARQAEFLGSTVRPCCVAHWSWYSLTWCFPAPGTRRIRAPWRTHCVCVLSTALEDEGAGYVSISVDLGQCDLKMTRCLVLYYSLHRCSRLCGASHRLVPHRGRRSRSQKSSRLATLCRVHENDHSGVKSPVRERRAVQRGRELHSAS